MFQRNWKIDEYPTKQQPPMYDLAERRAKYPEHYGDRYSGTLKQGNFSKKTDYLSEIPRQSLVEKKEEAWWMLVNLETSDRSKLRSY